MVCLGIYAVQLLFGYDNYGLVCLDAQSVTQKLQGDNGKHTGATNHITGSTHLPTLMLTHPSKHLSAEAINCHAPQSLASQSYTFDTQAPGLHLCIRAYTVHIELA